MEELVGAGPAAARGQSYVWVQGQRRPKSGSWNLSWQEVLWCRLTGQLGASRSTGTRNAEMDLHIPPHAYYYVHAPHPRFSDTLVAFYGQDAFSLGGVAVAPFDSGGLVAPRHSPHISINEPDTLERRRLLFRWKSTAAPGYEAQLDSWIARAFANREAYSSGVPPRSPYEPAILLDAESDRSAWLWEGRVLAIDWSAPPVKPVRIFLKPGHKSRYFDWLDQNPRMSAPDLELHYEQVETAAQETPNPYQAMLSYLA